MTQTPLEPAAADRAPSHSKLRPFIVEALVSAGPRKSRKDTELCEDCIGLCWAAADRLLFWLCDGASEEAVLPRLTDVGPETDAQFIKGFSARILAKDIGQAVAEHLCQHLQANPHLMGEALELEEAFDGVAASWKKRLGAYLAREERQGNLDKLLKRFPSVKLDWTSADQQDLKSLRTQDWSTTFLGGVFDPMRRELIVWNYGDSGAIVLGSEPGFVYPNTACVMLEARLETRERLEVRTKAILGSSGSFRKRFTGVLGFAAMSDGVVRSNLDSHLRKLGYGSLASFSELRDELMRTADDLTWDDKSVIFGRFLGE